MVAASPSGAFRSFRKRDGLVVPFNMAKIANAVYKAGVAAEVLAAPEHSVGGMLYRAKIYLENPEMLAWTLCVVGVSMGLEHLLKHRLREVRR